VRMAYVLNIKDIENAMICLAEALKVYPGRVAESKKLKAESF